MRIDINKCSVYIKIFFIFIFLISFTTQCFAAISLEKTLVSFEKGIEFESDVSVITIFSCFILILFAIALIIILIILYKKIPKTVAYIGITLSIVAICVIAILYGEELSEFCQKIMSYQMKIMNSRLISIQ